MLDLGTAADHGGNVINVNGRGKLVDNVAGNPISAVGTAFTIDPKEEMITVFMAQLHPTGGLELDKIFHVLAYQAITN